MSEAAPKRPAKTAYSRGARLELRVKRELEAKGYKVIRSAGSGGCGDLWAKFLEDDLWIIQCRRDGALSPGEWNALYWAAEEVRAWAIIASAAPRKPVRYLRITGECIPYSRKRLSEEVTP